MNSGKSLLSQVLLYIPKYQFDKLVIEFKANYRAREFSVWEQYVCMAFAQFTYRDSLRDIEGCLEAFNNKLYHCGIRSKVAKSTLAYWNNRTDWRLFSSYAQHLIYRAKKIYVDDNETLQELNLTVFAFDSTTIDLCLNLFPWAKFRKAKGAIKAHTLLDLNGNIPTWILLTNGSVHDVNALDYLPIESGAYYVMDRGYIDFKRLYTIAQHNGNWITRAKDNFSFIRMYSNICDRTTGLICDQVIKLEGHYASNNYPDKLRRIKYRDPTTNKTYVFITNCFTLDAIVICRLYKMRWHVELFFKWIKQNLKIKSFYGTSTNAVYSQIWIAVITYLIIAIIKKEIKSDFSMAKLLQIISVGCFEKIEINQAFKTNDIGLNLDNSSEQLNLFDF
jgi:hypothetical protein